ncbi:MAG: hypothetical protein WD227_10935 [Vicinamibacterales bacterium]
MSQGDDLLNAIADAGGINAIDMLRHLVDLSGPEHLLDLDGGLLPFVLEALEGQGDEPDARLIKAILWDARSLAVAAADIPAETKNSRLEILDRIGLLLFPPVLGRTCRVAVRTCDLMDAFRVLEAAQRGASVRLSFRGDELVLTRRQASARVRARGEWPLVAVLPGRVIHELVHRAAALPHDLTIAGSDTMLHFSHFSIRCRWERDAE